MGTNSETKQRKCSGVSLTHIQFISFQKAQNQLTKRQGILSRNKKHQEMTKEIIKTIINKVVFELLAVNAKNLKHQMQSSQCNNQTATQQQGIKYSTTVRVYVNNNSQ